MAAEQARSGRLWRRLLAALGPVEQAHLAGSVVIGCPSSHAEADLIVGMLEANGIPAIASADDAGGMYLSLTGVRVLVDASDEDAALALLGDHSDFPAPG
jgi:hypothetical protein